MKKFPWPIRIMTALVLVTASALVVQTIQPVDAQTTSTSTTATTTLNKAQARAMVAPVLAQALTAANNRLSQLRLSWQAENANLAQTGRQLQILSATIGTLNTASSTLPDTLQPSYQSTLNVTGQYLATLQSQIQSIATRRASELVPIQNILQTISQIVVQLS